MKKLLFVPGVVLLLLGIPAAAVFAYSLRWYQMELPFYVKVLCFLTLPFQPFAIWGMQLIHESGE